MPNSTVKLYSLSEIAQILGVDERQLHRFAHKGLIDPKLSNDRKARFKEIDCVRLKTIKQADELGYEPDAIFRLIGKPDEVLAAEDPIANCEDFAMANYKQIYDELNHCEPLEQLNKQCDLRLLKGYIKDLKEVRTGEISKIRKPKEEPPKKVSSAVQGVKASTSREEAGQALESAPSPNIRTYSVAKYWEYMKKVEELQKEVSADSPQDDKAPLSAPPDSTDDELEMLTLAEDLDVQPPRRRQVLDDDPERPESFQRPQRAFDKQQSWGVWILAGAFLLLIVAGYFFISGPDEKSSNTAPPQAQTGSPQAVPQMGASTEEPQLPAEDVASKGRDAETAQVEVAQTDTSVSQPDLEVADLSLWHDSLNDVYRADFSIAKSQTADEKATITGYAFVYLEFGDKTSHPKSLLLPTGEMQASKPAQVRKGARFTIKNFIQMQVAATSDLSPTDIVASNVLVYSPDGSLMVEKSFDVSVHPFFAASQKTEVPKEQEKVTEPPVAQIEPREPEPPPVVVPQTPPSDVKDTPVAAPVTETQAPPPVATPPASTAEAPATGTTRPETRIEEKTLAETAPATSPGPSTGDSGKDRRISEPEPSGAKIQSTGNPEAATWEQRSYNAAVQGDFEKAIASATKAIELDPSRVNPYINRAWAYLEKDMLEAAINDCKTALSIDPQNAFAYNNRGLVYQRKGKLSLAEKDYTRACDLGLELGCQNLDELTKQSRVEQLIDQSQVAFNAKDWEAVIRITTEVIDLDPQNAVAYTNRSAAYAQKDFLNKALKDSNDAIKFNPDFSLAYNNRGYVLELLGNKRQASVDYLKSCSLGLDLGCKNYERLSKVR